MRDERRIVSLRLDEDMFKRFKIYCVEKDCTMQACMIELLKEHLEKAEKEYSTHVRK